MKLWKVRYELFTSGTCGVSSDMPKPKKVLRGFSIQMNLIFNLYDSLQSRAESHFKVIKGKPAGDPMRFPWSLVVIANVDHGYGHYSSKIIRLT